MLLTLKQSICPHLEATIPARVQSYLSSGKPILGMAGRGVQSLINGNSCGIIADSGDYKSLADNILKLYNNKSALNTMSQNARSLYEALYTKDICITNLVNLINK